MILDSESLCPFFHGWVSSECAPEGMRFLRFSGKEAQNYRDPEQFNYEGSRFYEKTFASSGICFEVVTNASELVMKCHIGYGSSRTFYYFDVFVDGILCGHLGVEDYSKQEFFTLKFPLDGKKHRIRVHFPCLCMVEVQRVELKDASLAKFVQKKGLLLAYGDSITQGYDARYPSFAYTNQLADALDFQVINKAIGGDRFRPQLLSDPDETAPNVITVGYGTNDWSHSPREVLHRDAKLFFDRLAEIYPGVPVFAILPIWRGNCDCKDKPSGTFFEVAEYLRSICSAHPQIRVVDGLLLVPHLPDFFSPDILHPNDHGFQEYGKNLISAVRQAGFSVQ